MLARTESGWSSLEQRADVDLAAGRLCKRSSSAAWRCRRSARGDRTAYASGLERLETHRQRAQRLTGEATYRAWRLHMAGSAHGFHTNRLGVYQTLLAKPYRDGTSHLPLTATTGTPRNRLTRVRVARSELPRPPVAGEA